MKLSHQILMFIEENYSRIMVGLAIIFFMIMITGIREFINYSTIIDATQNTVDEQQYWEEKIAFDNNFLLPYLESDTARYFFAHENGSLFG
jgi:Na+-translocating ferredoxin:NAD+ oxidoreductase RnfE subunit